MANDFLNATLGSTGRRVFRLGLSASYRPGRVAIRSAIDHGVNYFFAYGFDTQMMATLRDASRTRRDELVIATGGYNWILWRSNLRKALEHRLRQLRTDYLDVFPHLAQQHPGLVSYTATRWSFLLRRTKGWPRERPVPTAGLAYRFVLSNPNVDVVLTAPSNAAQLAENLAEVAKGPLTAEEMSLMRAYGDAVHAQRQWFM